MGMNLYTYVGPMLECGKGTDEWSIASWSERLHSVAQHDKVVFLPNVSCNFFTLSISDESPAELNKISSEEITKATTEFKAKFSAEIQALSGISSKVEIIFGVVTRWA